MELLRVKRQKGNFDQSNFLFAFKPVINMGQPKTQAISHGPGQSAQVSKYRRTPLAVGRL